MTAIDDQKWFGDQVQDWLFAILRFAVTLRRHDRTAALSLGAALDLSGSPAASRFSFFERTSADVCKAIAEPGTPGSETVLRRHIARIDDARLARAFAAAVGLDRGGDRRVEWQKSARADLWRGLAEPRRSAS